MVRGNFKFQKPIVMSDEELQDYENMSRIVLQSKYGVPRPKMEVIKRVKQDLKLIDRNLSEQYDLNGLGYVK